MKDKQEQALKPENGKRTINTWVIVLTLLGVGAAPCPDCGMPLAIHFWPLALLLAIARVLADRGRVQSAKTAPEKQLDPDIEKRESP